MAQITHLPGRGVLALQGPDRITFLTGLVSNDAALAAPGRAVWAALLTAQGRYLTDFFIFSDGTCLLLDCPRDAIPNLITKLSRYRLRAAVTLTDLSDTLHVHASWGGTPPEIAITAPDPRLREAGFRSLADFLLPPTASTADYATHRLNLGLPDGPPDLEPDKTLLLEAGFDELGGIDWNKGCYMGQELTARTKYRGLLKKRFYAVTTNEALPPTGTMILADGQEAGSIRSSLGGIGSAMIRLSAINQKLTAGGTLISPIIPPWMPI